MKTTKVVLMLVVGILLLPAIATANQVQLLWGDEFRLVEFTFPDAGHSHSNIVAGKIIGQMDAQIGANSGDPTNTTGFFCIDLNHTFDFGHTYNYEYFDLTGNWANAAKLVKAFGGNSLDNDHAAGLQAAIWSTIYGSQFNLVTDGNVAAYMGDYLNQLSGLPAAPEYKGLDLFTIDGAGHRTDFQDLISVPPAHAPEPGALFLLGCGLLGLFVMSGRRRLSSLTSFRKR